MKKFIKQNINNIFVLLIYIAMFFGVAELTPIIFGDLVETESQKILFTILNNVFIYSILFVSCVILLKKEVITDFKVLEKQNAIKVFLICLAGVGLIYAGNFVGNIIVTILGGADNSLNQSAIEKILLSKYGFVMIIFLVVIGPISEELVFRKSFREIFNDSLRK